MNRNVLLPLFALLLLVTQTALGQVTTSSMSGVVTDGKEALMAATVQAVHTPSGTKYYAHTNAAGKFFINNMRVGGPYTVEVSYVGFAKTVHQGITLKLGENYILNVKMSESANALSEVVVTAGGKNPVFNSARTGAMTNIGARELRVLPTISRSLNDFTRLTPQANGSSFGGRDGRMNNISIDGGAFNNNFGLGGGGLPGGGAQPISLDAIEEVSVNIAPYDVRLSRFTGASVNAVTKSGGNMFRGSAYTYQRPKIFTGEKVGDAIVRNARERQEQTYGFTLSGPIIKDKLFFFANAEIESKVSPYSGFYPSTDGKEDKVNKIARTTVADLEKMHKHLLDKYGYEAGKFQGFEPMSSKNMKLLAKIDWNINQNHKLSLRYNYLRNNSNSLTNASSAPPKVTRANVGRISEKSITFSNSFFSNLNTVHGIAGELNSRLGDNMSNKFMVTYTATVNPERVSPSAPFPMVDIFNGGEPYMTFGHELFSYRNKVVNNNFTFSNDFTYNLGDHTLLAGIGYENIYVYNSYVRSGTSYYRYASMDDFINGAKPLGFGVTYGYGGKEPGAVDLNFGLASAYIQDDWQITPNFKLSAGLRLELPLYLNKLQDNPAVAALPAFPDGFKLDLGTWPKTHLMYNPRLGFNWDVTGDRSVQLRGGTGLFTGVLPFVWFTNQPTNSGMIQSPEMGFAGENLPDGFVFNPNWKEQVAKYPDLFPSKPAERTNGSFNVAQVDKNFHMPQVWRTNLAVDIALPGKTTLTLEGLYTKDVYGITQRNYNYPDVDDSKRMPDGRAYYSANTIRRDIGSVVVLQNNNTGYQASFTAQLKKEFAFGLDAMLAYTYNIAKDETENPGDAAYSAWSNNLYVDNMNAPGISYSKFAVPHRLVGSLSYRVDYLKHFATTVSLFYTGSHQGRGSYIFARDVNGDRLAKDLLYIPKAGDRTSVPFADTNNMTAEDQAKAFEAFIQSEPYLKKISDAGGGFAGRFAVLEPWINRFDLKLAQDIYSNFGTDRRYTMQLSLDVINVGNLLNPNWGVYKTYGLPTSYGNISVLTTDRAHKPEVPKYLLNAKSIEDFQAKTQWKNDVKVSSTWGMLFGLRFIF